MKLRAEGSVVVRKNPGYNPGLKKDWLVIDAGTCVGEFDSESEANTHCENVIDKKPKREESGLSRYQELKNEYRNTPKKEIKKRRQLKTEIALLKAQEAQQSGKTRRAVKKGLEEAKQGQLVKAKEDYSKHVETKAKTFHYHKGRRGRCNCEKGDDR